MKIEDYRESVTFGDLGVGECFEYEGDICMKVIGRIVSTADNAVDLGWGALTQIDDDVVVRRVAAKVVID